MVRKLKTLDDYKRLIAEGSPSEVPRKKGGWFKPNYRRALELKSPILKMDNQELEEFYFSTLSKIKSLIKQLPNKSDRLVYELDRKFEPENHECLYDFFSPQIRFHLYCWFDCKYLIHYTIAESPIKKDLVDLINPGLRKGYNMEEIPLKPDYQTYYQNSMTFRKEHTHFL